MVRVILGVTLGRKEMGRNSQHPCTVGSGPREANGDT